MPAVQDPKREFSLFVYGSLLPGERDHELLSAEQHLGSARTPAAYYLIELSGLPALVAGGTLEVSGELYRVSAATLHRIDVRKDHPVLFRRETIQLAAGKSAEAYLMTLDQVRGRRRLKIGDWRQRFQAPPSSFPKSPWARWARERFSKT